MIFCSFCGTAHEGEGTIFEGPQVAICADCVVLAVQVMLKGWPREELADGKVVQGTATRSPPTIPGPSDPDYGSTYGTPVWGDIAP